MDEEIEEAIKILEKAKMFYKDFGECNIKITMEKEDIKKLIILLNYISKLQKENEFLKAPFEYANGNTLDKRYVEMNFVSKDKIKAEIKELEEILEKRKTIDIIEEINRLEDLLKEE